MVKGTFTPWKLLQIPVEFMTRMLLEKYSFRDLSAEDKKAFADQYHATKNAKAALAAYTGSDYDVILYAPNPDDASSYTLVDIRTFIEETGVSYNFPDEY